MVISIDLTEQEFSCIFDEMYPAFGDGAGPFKAAIQRKLNAAWHDARMLEIIKGRYEVIDGYKLYERGNQMYPVGNPPRVCIEDSLEVEELEALIWWMKNKGLSDKEVTLT